jgi:hypothetical protein
VMGDESFEHGGDLLLLAARKLRRSFKQPSHFPVGPVPRFFLPLLPSSLPRSSATGTPRALAQLRTTSRAGLMSGDRRFRTQCLYYHGPGRSVHWDGQGRASDASLEAGLCAAHSATGSGLGLEAGNSNYRES